jgi:GTPase SAR1 family protein
MDEVEQHAEKNVLLVMVGNKLDLTEERQVSEEEARNFCKSKDVKYIECSAKDGNHILDIFT